MLKLIDIVKNYESKGNIVNALKGISITFRDSEFVSILGPSGCGKTTLLNILGGLDHYTSGNLIIDNKSTKDYKAHDWDIYRNHRIGFIFQSYNLIPHQNIIDNVSLALTIAGVSKEERDRRSKEMLDKVGLANLYKKMPNQLSGGQCQRVAIARALVNDPEILLADEPTGALDSKTSVQIMELIQEIAKDRLVIMVTHNPELAEKYSTRIVKLLDGNLISDSMPYVIEDENLIIEDKSSDIKDSTTSPVISKSEANEEEIDIEEKAKENLENTINSNDKNEVDTPSKDIVLQSQSNGAFSKSKPKMDDKESAKMSLWQAFKLSGKNLLSKIKRTIMTVFAASIGIVGVSAVLAVSNGVTGYINSMQDDMLSGNPLAIERESFDLSKLMQAFTPQEQQDLVKDSWQDGYLNVNYLTKTVIETGKSLQTSQISNTITKEYVDYLDSIPKSAYAAMDKDYGIDVNNNIYAQDQVEGYAKDTKFSLSSIINIASNIAPLAAPDEYKPFVKQVLSSLNNSFKQAIDNVAYLEQQYDVIGKIATEENEIMLVTNSKGQISDMSLTLMGYYGQDEFINLLYKFIDDPQYDDEAFKKANDVSFEQIMSKKFYYYKNDDIFYKNDDDQTSIARPFYYIDRIDDTKPQLRSSTPLELSVVGILRPKENKSYSSLSSGFYYSKKFTDRFLMDNYDSEISKFVRQQDEESQSFTSYDVLDPTSSKPIKSGIFYDFHFKYLDNPETTVDGFIGKSTSYSTFGSLYTIDSNMIGGNNIPNSIYIYPKSFDKKYLITDYLKKWNSDEVIKYSKGENSDEEIIILRDKRENMEYSDNLEVIISLINTMIQMITIALVAFTALSLVVSTVMIAIITYVSVMERVKEIGIIRALGGRKEDVSRLFNIETLVIGTASGVFGIAITYLIQIILNAIISSQFSQITMIANLDPFTAIIVILISILLSVISGIIPAFSAARKDPVVALRTE